jgi:TfoX/Sxy family transcriptional regulator of competence genes
MAYDERLARRVAAILSTRKDVSERKMFGGIAFMVGDKMACGVVRDRLMVRIGSEAYDEALAKPHVHPMDFTGRPSRGMVYVAAEGAADDADLERWVSQGVTYAESLVPK